MLPGGLSCRRASSCLRQLSCWGAFVVPRRVVHAQGVVLGWRVLVPLCRVLLRRYVYWGSLLLLGWIKSLYLPGHER